MSELPEDRREPHPDRLPAHVPGRDRILAAHRAALAQDLPGYLDPISGLWVFTAESLWRRGSCCRSGCRHCPFVARP